MFTSLFTLTISLYTPLGVYCVIYPSFRGNIEEFDFSIPMLRMIYCTIFPIAVLYFPPGSVLEGKVV